MFIGKVEESTALEFASPPNPGGGRGPDKKPRKRRSDAGTGRGGGIKEKAKQGAELAGKGAVALGTLAVGDQIAGRANKTVGQAANRVRRSAMGRARKSGMKRTARVLRGPRANTRAARLGSIAKYGAYLAIGDAAVRGANSLAGGAVASKPKLKERAKEIRERRRKDS